MKAIANDLDTKRNFSRIDDSGTDPNRYASVSNEAEAHTYTAVPIRSRAKSPIPGIRGNVSVFERFISAAAGTYLLYNGLSGKHRNIVQTAAGGALLARAISGYCPAYALADSKLKSENVNIRTSIIIDRPVDQVYNFWRRLENLPKFMSHLDSVTPIDELTSAWKAKGPAGVGSISWKAEILMDEKGRMLSWHSLPGSTIDNAGKVVFHEKGNNKTELDITISYHAPMGVAGEAAARFINPLFRKIVESDVAQLKSYLEESKALTE